MVHLLDHTELLGRRRAVAAADHAEPMALGHSMGDRLRARLEAVILELDEIPAVATDLQALAGSGGYQAASSNYGGLTKKALAGLAESCPMVGSYGALDRGLKKEPEQISAVLEAHGIPYDMEVYPDAGHSFMNNHLDSEVPKWAVIMGKLSKSDYHESSAMDARRRITSFFVEHLA